ncbi:MAG: hotdog fold thioesterase [Verrucomicrobia bacterium]|nr:hotdog fold thioesterase [Verrucomicrobiota bacterium]
MMTALGIEFHEITENSLSFKMPVDARTFRPPGGMLNGGAAAALVENVGSFAAQLTLKGEAEICVGIELNISHLKPATEGYVIGTATPIRLGVTLQVWEVRNVHSNGDLISIGRLTMLIRKIA